MPTLGERVVSLEGRVNEQSHTIDGIHGAVVSLEGRVVSLEGCVVSLEGRVVSLEGRVVNLEDRMDRRFDAIDRRFESIDRKIDQHFAWLVGIQLTTTVTIVAAVLAALVQR